MNNFVLILGVSTLGLGVFIFACTLFLRTVVKYDKIQYCYGCKTIIEREEQTRTKRP